MTTPIVGDHPEVAALIRERQARGLDGHDEVWDGVYHVVPPAGLWHAAVQADLAGVLRDLVAAEPGRHPVRQPEGGLAVTVEFTLGARGDHRVPDLGVHRSLPDQTYVATAAIVVEVLSRDDETFEKFAFYAAHEVDEIHVVDVAARTVAVWALTDGEYDETGFSAVLGVHGSWLAGRVDWPGGT